MTKLIAMTNPYAEIKEEVNFLQSLDLDGIEISLEPPCWYLKDESIEYKEKFVRGHTRSDFYFSSEKESERNEHIEEYKKNLDFFKILGLEYVNIHPHYNKEISRELCQKYNYQAINEILKYARKIGIKIMIENQFPFESSSEMKKVLDKFEDLYLLYDIAHAYYMNKDKDFEVESFIINFKDRIKHIHLSDNEGEDDDHYFIGYGNINFKKYLEMAKSHLYKDVTYSLEPFVIDLGNGEWRVSTKEERAKLLKESIEKIRKIIG